MADAAPGPGSIPDPDPDVDAAILTGLCSWLDAADPTASHTVTGHQAPAAGYSSRTLLVDLNRRDTEGVHPQRLVLKVAPAGSAIFDRYDFAMQTAVQEAAAAAGIPTAHPATAEADPAWLGEPFMVMPFVEGQIFGEAPALDRRLSKGDAEANAGFHGRFIDLMADINRLDWVTAGLDGVVPRRDNAAELAYWRAYLGWYADGEEIVPTLSAALEWCEANRPDSEPSPSLLWGDVRIGNVIVDDDLVPQAVLDWEMATIGAAEHDLAWVLTLDATQEALMGRTVPGFADRDACVARYQERLGRPVRDLEWYEVLACIRSSAVMSRIAHLNDLRGEANYFPIADNPILDLLSERIRTVGA